MNTGLVHYRPPTQNALRQKALSSGQPWGFWLSFKFPRYEEQLYWDIPPAWKYSGGFS